MESLTKPRTGSRRKTLKDESPKPAKVEAGLNGVDADTVLVYLGKIAQEEARVAAAKKRLKKVWKLALNEGIVRKDLELVRKFADQDPETVLATIARIKQYAQWLDVPIGQHLSLLEWPTGTILKTEEWAERAYRAGYVQGLRGLDPDTQAYPSDNEFHQKHVEGWHAGQKVLLSRIQPINMALDSDGKEDGAKLVAEPGDERDDDGDKPTMN